MKFAEKLESVRKEVMDYLEYNLKMTEALGPLLGAKGEETKAAYIKEIEHQKFRMTLGPEVIWIDEVRPLLNYNGNPKAAKK